MARLAPGAYGDLQSALFNVLVDEYGAAVHAAKHSTLFEKTMGSVGLSADPHHYWQFYQPSALALTNYFHYLARNKRHFFRYLGALFFTETVLINVTRRQAAMLETVFGNAIDKRYFDEHRHIDQHHSQMVLKRLIEPAAAKYGAVAIKEIVRGFEEFRLLQTVADVDLVNQLTWAGRLSKESAEVKSYLDYARQSRDLEQETFVERLGERSTTHIHPDNRLLMIETGEMDFYPLAGSTLHLRPGDVLFIPQGRLHGSVVCTEICTYHQPIVPPADAVALSIAA
jgi:mannose-6-phosphate isomerase-like protein (cupin superfamily)